MYIEMFAYSDICQLHRILRIYRGKKKKFFRVEERLHKINEKLVYHPHFLVKVKMTRIKLKT